MKSITYVFLLFAIVLSVVFSQPMTALAQEGGPTDVPTEPAITDEGDVSALAGVTWYVATTGNDANDCSTTSTPCATINGAIGKSANGDTIQVAGGTYTGTGTQVVLINKSITLSGGWDNTFSSQDAFSIIDGQNARTGIYNTSTNITIDHFIVRNGYTTSKGGGIYNYIGSFTINNSLIINNKSTNGGGGIFSGGNLNINNSTIEGNSSSYDGGGIEIYLLDNSLTLSNSTIAGNQANNYGGGISLDYSSGGGTPGTITMQNSTLVHNSAKIGGGIYIGGGSSRTVNITNGIIAKNTASTGPDCSGIITSSNYNVIGNTLNCTVTVGMGDQFNVDPQLPVGPSGALHYYALLSNSPAIDAGANCLPTDQRGISRPQGTACDIGAYEYTTPGTALLFGVANGSNQRTGELLPFPLPLAIYVVDGSGSPVSGVNVTFIAPVSGASGTFADTSTNTTTVITNNSGQAISSIFTANSQLSTYNVVVTVSSLPGSVEIVLTNANLFVSPTGNDANLCSSPESPCLTINGVINKAVGGELIKIVSGTYTGNASPVANITKSLTLSGGWDSFFNLQTGYSTIDGNGKAYHGVTLNTSGSVTMSRLKIQNSYYGINNNGGVLNLDKVSLISNKNGVRNIGGTVTITNSTISGNIGGTSAGSAIYSVFGKVNIQYSTISNNAAYAVWNDRAHIEFGSSIIAGNSNGDCGGNSIMTSDGYNIFGSPAGCASYPPINLAPTDQAGVDPKLLPLLLAGYHPILPGSPAIDSANAATCPTTDQSNATRPIGAGCDIGAYEYYSVTISGNAGAVGATLNYAENGTPKITTVNESGNYSFNVPSGWSGTVTPFKLGWSFTPDSIDYTNVLADQTNQDYTATRSAWIISGNVRPAGVTLSYNDNGAQSVISDSNGNYELPVSFGWSGTVTPSLVGNSFLPINRVYTNVLEDFSAQDYAPTVPTLVSPTGATTDKTPTYNWTQIIGATQYQVQLFKGTKLVYSKTVLPSACGATTCSNTPSTALSDSSKYKWRVRAMVGGIWQAYTPKTAFTLGPKAGYWSGAYTDFYVTPNQNKVDNFAVYISVRGCGNYKITHTQLASIVNQKFSFGGKYYANGVFNNAHTRASGTVGFSSFFLPGCGTISGSLPWKTVWRNINQPALAKALEDLFILTLPELDQDPKIPVFTVDPIQP